MDLELRVGAEVACSDGLAGSVKRLIIDPTTEKVTHLVVDSRPHFGYEVLVPESKVTSANLHFVQLSCSRVELKGMERFEQMRYLPADTEEVAPPPEWREYLVPAAPTPTFGGTTTGGVPYLAVLPAQPVAEVAEAIPEGEVEVGRHARVRTADDHVGHVEDIVVDPSTGRMTHFVMRTGHLWGQRAFDVPVSAIAEVRDDEVRLRLTREEVEALAERTTGG